MKKMIISLSVVLFAISFCCTNNKMLPTMKTGTDDSIEYVNLVPDSADNSKSHSGYGTNDSASAGENMSSE